MWLVAGIYSYILNLPELADREHTFDICYSLLEHKSKSNQSSGNMTSSEEQLKKFSTAESPIDVLTNSPEKSEFYRELLLKGIKTNLLYITDLPKTSLANISADDNGAYLKSRITNKKFFSGNDQVITVHEVNDKYYYSKRESHNSYSKVYVSADNVVSFHRTWKNNEFSFTTNNRKDGKSNQWTYASICCSILSRPTDHQKRRCLVTWESNTRK